jgi:hypothetical protein
MTFSYGFYNSLNGDRTYDAVQLSSMFDGVIEDGVFESVGTAFVIRESTGMNVIVGEGKAWFKHTWTVNDSDFILPIDASEVVLNRIDVVVLEVDSSDLVRENAIKVVKGTPGSSPVAPTLIDTDTLTQYPLAHVLVEGGVTSLPQAKITNYVGTVDTPFVIGVLESFDVDALLAQWDSEFNIWFDAMKDQLTTDAAGNLQTQIDAIEADIVSKENGWLPISGTMTHVSVDGSTGVVNFNSNLTAKLLKGTRIKYKQTHALSLVWPLDSNANGSVGGLNGTPTNISYVAAKYGNGASFNGTTSLISFTDNSAFKPTSRFTLGFTIKTSVVNSQTIFNSCATNAGSFYGILVQVLNNVIRVSIGNANGFVGIDGRKTVTDNVLHDIVVTYNNNCVQVYVDDVLDINEFAPDPGYYSTNYVRFGAYKFDGTPESGFFNGIIDDLYMINDYALDEETIVAKYASGAAIGTASLNVTKKAIVTKVGQYSGGNTQVTFWGGSDNVLVNATITEPHYSNIKIPFGFNVNEKKWRAMFYDGASIKSKASPVSGTYYYSDMGSKNLVVPIGLWDLEYETEFYGQSSAPATSVLTIALSRSNSAATDIKLRLRILGGNVSAANPYCGITARGKDVVIINTKTTYYLIYKTDSALTSINSDSASGAPTTIIARFLYL